MFRKAIFDDLDSVESIYDKILQYEDTHEKYTVFQKGVYPTRETAKKALRTDSLFVLEEAAVICASVILNNMQPEEYGKIKWSYPAKPGKAAVIHLLCVNPEMTGQGIGQKTILEVIAECRKCNYEVIRLDTGAQNKPANNLYTRTGFSIAGTSDMRVGGRIAHADHLFYEIKV